MKEESYSPLNEIFTCSEGEQVNPCEILLSDSLVPLHIMTLSWQLKNK